MENISARIFRHEPPTKYDTAPCGTECKVDHKNYFEIYLQLSTNEEDPKWVLIGEYSHSTPNDIIQQDIDAMVKPIQD